MNESSSRLLRDLLRQPMSLASIATEFEPGQGDSVSDEYLERLVSMLRRLEQLGLIEKT